MTQVFNIAEFGACAQVWWRFFFFYKFSTRNSTDVHCFLSHSLSACLRYFIILLILCWLWPVAMWICCWHCQKYAYLTYKPPFWPLVRCECILFIYLGIGELWKPFNWSTYISFDPFPVRRMRKNSTHREGLKETKKGEERGVENNRQIIMHLLRCSETLKYSLNICYKEPDAFSIKTFLGTWSIIWVKILCRTKWKIAWNQVVAVSSYALHSTHSMHSEYVNNNKMHTRTHYP